MKKTVSTYWYFSLLAVKTPFQNFWTLLTTPTIRQSSRWFASAPDLQSCEIELGVSPLPDARVVQWAELPEPAASGEQRDQQVGDQADDAQAAAAEREAARAAAAAGVRDLAGVEGGSPAETHLRSVPAPTLPDARFRG